MSPAHLTARAAGVVLIVVLLFSGAPTASAQKRVHALLDVPFVSQTPELCGGAAVAMVLRYWGERQVFPEDFGSIVVASERGIPTASLVDAVRKRHWQAVVIAPDGNNAHAQIHQAIDRGQPLIALIEVSARTYHYVVIVGATDDEVVMHDPARSPLRVVSWAGFDRAWEPAGRWMMLVLPPTADVRSAPASPVVDSSSPPKPCDALVDRGVALALGTDREAAEEALVGATRLCPAHPGAWRELAGWRFSQSRWADAQALAATAVRLAPDDAHARELLATSRYLSGDLLGALDAWTPAGEPRIDAVSVHGADRTRHPVVVSATGLQPRQLLTSEVLTRAERRVQALPAATVARLQYEPLGSGLARVDVSVSERDPFPRGWMAFTILGGRAAVGHEVKVDVAGMAGAGERLSVSARWQQERPRVALALAAPSPGRLPGVMSFDGSWERQSYATVRESRRRMALQWTDWSTSRLRWTAGVALDRFDARRYVSLEGGLDLRLARDRIALVASGRIWTPTAGAHQFATRALLAAWRSTADMTGGAWSVQSELSAAGSEAPLAVWEGAGTGSGRASLLRAHPLLREGVVTGAVFGRRVARGTVEYARPVSKTIAGTVAIAGFIDAAQAWRRIEGARSPLLVDAGVGVRLRMPGRAETLRLDFAHGLRGGGATVSIGWLGVWPH
ncbi:MAG: C39 family peptidase [Vicinamibacterales bacterium]